MDLSIVIPAYNEARKIGRDVQEAARFLREQGLSGEIIVAADGCNDGTAAAARAVPMPKGIELRVLELTRGGKGSAVRHGIQATRGDLVMFMDTGYCVPLENVLPALDLLRSDQADIANGSRKMRGSIITVPQAFHRRVFSRMFRLVVKLYLGLPMRLTDTQCGFKAYRGDVARDLYGACVTDGFLFDLEVLIRAKMRGYRVTEFPVHWTCDRDSRLKPSHEMLHTLPDLRALKKRLATEPAETPASAQAAEIGSSK